MFRERLLSCIFIYIYFIYFFFFLFFSYHIPDCSSSTSRDHIRTKFQTQTCDKDHRARCERPIHPTYSNRGRGVVAQFFQDRLATNLVPYFTGSSFPSSETFASSRSLRIIVLAVAAAAAIIVVRRRLLDTFSVKGAIRRSDTLVNIVIIDVGIISFFFFYLQIFF